MNDQNPDKPGRFEPVDFVEARQYADERRGAIAAGYGPTDGTQIASPELSKYFFSLQGALEKQGPMDYRSYATKLWEQLVGPIAEQNEGFRHFEATLVMSLHDIDMSKMVYPEVIDNIAGLVEEYGDAVKSVGVWSTGDVTATGYQLAKIERSGVRGAFFDAFASRDAGTQYARDKTFYMVHDDKINGLTEYVAEKIDSEADEPLKVVIIDDSVKNFERAQTALDERFGANCVEVIPIWFTGSREGQIARSRAEIGGVEAKAALDKQMLDLHAIASFDELLDTDRFGDVFDDSNVMVDFDGVIGDNIAMRIEQARVIYNSLLEGAQIATGMPVEELAARFEAALPVAPS